MDDNLLELRPTQSQGIEITPAPHAVDRDAIIERLPDVLEHVVASLQHEIGYEENKDNAVGLSIRLLTVTADRLRL